MTVEDPGIGRRVREIRVRRGMTMSVTAGLAGISQSYLSMIEHGRRAVEKRSLVEGLAEALRVSPAELSGKPYPADDRGSRLVAAALDDIGDTLTGWWVDEVPEIAVRPWEEVMADLDRVNHRLRPNADYEAQAAVLPRLVRELLVSVNGARRRESLIGLISAYKAVAYLCHDVGAAGLPALAVERLYQAAVRLEDAGWEAYALYQRAQLLSGAHRDRQYELAVRVAQTSAARVETRGLAHLTAALRAAVSGDAELAATHVGEATGLAGRLEPDVSPWMQTNFGRTNVMIWNVGIGVELGHGVRAAEVAKGWAPTGVSKSRQAAFYLDVGRALSTEAKHRSTGLAAVLQAEQLAPQKIRNNPFAREIVSSALRKARKAAGGRDLQGLAHRMGIQPIG